MKNSAIDQQTAIFINLLTDKTNYFKTCPRYDNKIIVRPLWQTWSTQRERGNNNFVQRGWIARLVV